MSNKSDTGSPSITITVDTPEHPDNILELSSQEIQKLGGVDFSHAGKPRYKNGKLNIVLTSYSRVNTNEQFESLIRTCLKA